MPSEPSAIAASMSCTMTCASLTPGFQTRVTPRSAAAASAPWRADRGGDPTLHSQRRQDQPEQRFSAAAVCEIVQ
ncbi:MAG: hypothetical protein QMB90_10500 [Rubritalea sp.]